MTSELGHFSHLYGPQVLLYMNIAYYAPSIPLLIFQSFFDEALEASLGLARTILLRLVVGLSSYGIICAWFPFMPQDIWILLTAVVALGLFSSIAFSASYQMVARFANKNTIALGLGCSASGPLILVLQIALHINASPTFEQQRCLFLIMTGVVATGLWATVSLVLRHWDAIEASGGGGGGVEKSTLEEEPASAAAAFTASMEGDLTSPLLGAPTTAASPRVKSSPSLYKHPSLPPLLAYNLLQPYDTYLTAATDDDDQWRRQSTGGVQRRVTSPVRRSRVSADSFTDAETGEDRFREGGERGGGGERRQRQLGRTISAPPSSQEDGGGAAIFKGEYSPRVASVPSRHVQWEDASSQISSGEYEDDGVFDADIEDEEDVSGFENLKRTIRGIYPATIAIGLQAGIALTLFPFFTYLPSSGRFGAELPKVLFFVRIFADIVGRVLPRSPMFKPDTIWPVFVVAMCKLAAEPLFFLYLKSPSGWHSDMGIVVYIAMMWAAGGYVNTTSNMLAPHMVAPQYRSTAAGMMALTYQLGHFIGLGCAASLVHILYK